MHFTQVATRTGISISTEYWWRSILHIKLPVSKHILLSVMVHFRCVSWAWLIGNVCLREFGMSPVLSCPGCDWLSTHLSLVTQSLSLPLHCTEARADWLGRCGYCAVAKTQAEWQMFTVWTHTLTHSLWWCVPGPSPTDDRPPSQRVKRLDLVKPQYNLWSVIITVQRDCVRARQINDKTGNGTAEGTNITPQLVQLGPPEKVTNVV